MMVESKIEFAIEMIPKCIKQYKKLIKKDSILEKLTEGYIQELKENPYLGEKLRTNFDGWRSIHYYDNKYRIIYKIEQEPFPKIIILCIGHRKNAYSDLAKFLGMGF